MAVHVQRLRKNLVIKIIDTKPDGTPRDISGATTLEILLKHQSKDAEVFPAVLSTTGQDGAFEYATELQDLDHPGKWQAQGHVVNGADDYYTPPGEFYVDPNLNDAC